MTLHIDIQRKVYQDRGGRAHVALSGFKLSLKPGEFVCLVGPSGCGKSTLLNLIAGLDSDFDGRVAGDSSADDATAGIAYVFQEPRLMPWLNVLDNVLLVGSDSRDEMGRAALRDRAIELLEAMELGDVMHAWPSRLSGGMQRRVALARGFLNRPGLLLMDEPFVSLDAPTAARLRDMLLGLWAEERSTVLFVTHDVREALTLADRVCFLSPSPAQVVLEQSIELSRPRRAAEVDALLQTLLETSPDLLNGLTRPAAEEVLQ